MGNYLKSLNNFLTQLKSPQETLRITMIGLDAAGKTTILHRLKMGSTIQTIPTIGFNVETLQFKNQKFSVFDIGGQKKLRNMWQYYYENIDAIIYVVDSSDEKRLGLNKKTFFQALRNSDLENVPVLVFANKQDIATVGLKGIKEGMGLQGVQGRDWHLQGCSAVSGEGLVEGLEWLYGKLNK